MPKNTKRHDNRQKKIIEYTKSLANVKMILPVNQTHEAEVGDGRCYGYVIYWGKCLLEGKRPFGIDPNQPPFDYNPNFIKKNPDLNHFAKITKENSIHKYFWFQIVRFLGITFAGISTKAVTIIGYKKDSQQWAEKLCKQADQNLNQPLSLCFDTGFATAHATGLRKSDNGKIDYFDCNFGWLQFDNAEAFIKWFPNYLQIAYPEAKTIHYYDLHALQPYKGILNETMVITNNIGKGFLKILGLLPIACIETVRDLYPIYRGLFSFLYTSIGSIISPRVHHAASQPSPDSPSINSNRVTRSVVTSHNDTTIFNHPIPKKSIDDSVLCQRHDKPIINNPYTFNLLNDYYAKNGKKAPVVTQSQDDMSIKLDENHRNSSANSIFLT